MACRCNKPNSLIYLCFWPLKNSKFKSDRNVLSGIAISRRGARNPVTADISKLSNEKKIPARYANYPTKSNKVVRWIFRWLTWNYCVLYHYIYLSIFMLNIISPSFPYSYCSKQRKHPICIHSRVTSTLNSYSIISVFAFISISNMKMSVVWTSSDSVPSLIVSIACRAGWQSDRA
jgi:hypothetical protein